MSTDEIEIRNATDRDLGPLIDALGPQVDTAQIRRRLHESASGYRVMLVAVTKGLVVGTVSIGGSRFHRERSLRLFALDVGPAFRRKGIGTKLVKAIETMAESRDLDEVNLEVAIDNKTAIRFYCRLGFKIRGDTFVNRWQRELDDGSSETIEEVSFVMIKRLGSV